MTLKSDGVALATLATKATANIIIIAQAKAIGNRQLATKSRVVAEVSSPTSLHSAAARVNVRSGDILQHCGGLRWPGDTHSGLREQCPPVVMAELTNHGPEAAISKERSEYFPRHFVGALIWTSCSSKSLVWVK